MSMALEPGRAASLPGYGVADGQRHGAGSVTLRRIELARWWFTGVDDAEEPERDVVREYALRG